jgi:predicted amidohydrolase
MRKRIFHVVTKRKLIIGSIILLLIILIAYCDSDGSAFKKFLYDETKAQEFLNTAVVALQPKEKPRDTVRKMAEMVFQIKEEHPDIELVVFGETILGFYKYGDNTAQYHKRIAQPVPGEITDLLGEAAKRSNIYLSFGITEKREEKIFNSSVLLSPEGTIIAKHSKYNLKPAEKEIFSPGEIPVTYTEIKGIRTAMAICYDIQSRSVIKSLDKTKPELIILSNADWDKSTFGARYLARRFGAWGVGSNRYGKEFDAEWNGHIEISNPVGDFKVMFRGKEQYGFARIAIVRTPSNFKKFLQESFLFVSRCFLIVKNLGALFDFVESKIEDAKADRTLPSWISWNLIKWSFMIIIVTLGGILIWRRKKQRR